jgi:aryl-alcohol dehydrogenase-like predicted oxidoreductase
MYAWQFAQMLAISDGCGWPRFVTMQNHYNLLYREEEREMNPLCEAEGVGLIPWSPLARGVLAGSRKAKTTRSHTDDFANKLYGKDIAEADQRIVNVVEKIAEERGHNPAQIALAWLLHNPALVAPIVGASKPHHLDDAVAAIGIKLSAKEIARLEEHYVPHAIAGHE